MDYHILHTKYIATEAGLDIFYVEISGLDASRPALSDFTAKGYTPANGSIYYSCDTGNVYLWNVDQWSLMFTIKEE